MNMKTVILAGGLGTRISEETHLRPKPMIEIGGRPILWHIMKIYAAHGINDFIICAGYKGYVIKEYFANYFLHMSDVTFDIAGNHMEIHQQRAEPWRVAIIDTGEGTQTGGRLLRIKGYLDDGPFCFTYGDGVGDVNIGQLIRFHAERGREATVTAVQTQGRYGTLDVHDGKARSFREKPLEDGAWINGGYFVLEPSVFDRITGDGSVWEQDLMESLARDGQLSAFEHKGFWQPMDTPQELITLNSLWKTDAAPWKIWP